MPLIVRRAIRAPYKVGIIGNKCVHRQFLQHMSSTRDLNNVLSDDIGSN